MSDGRVADVGTLDELLARQPRFGEMWRGYTSDAAGTSGIGAA